jgi:DNA replication protein DnaC
MEVMTYPDGYIKNNTAEFYTAIENCVNNKQHFHFIFKGTVGCGKTHLARIIRKSLKDLYSAYLTWYYANDLYSEYVRLTTSNDNEDNWMLNIVKGYPDGMFVLDDLGSEHDTPASRNFFAQFIDNNYRYIKNGSAKVSIITTNLGEDEINNRYGSRAMDRLWENYTVFTFTDYSFRRADRKIINGEAK